ncbi:MAG: hypothetical protein SF070_01960 [Gemmatimonadota bacterium]|nr:hypothetical protein [Gemmatimonadota bacterium]
MRRPRSITLVAWIFIVVGAAGILKDLWPLLTADAAQHLARLKADGLADLGPAWTTRLLGVVGGVGLLHHRTWARWLLVAWMAFHLGISVMHSLIEVVMHAVIFAPLVYLMFRRSGAPYFQAGPAART